MPRIKYQDIKFRDSTLTTISLINSIVEEYKSQGFDLTLRQVYYQLVARGYIPNNERSYKNLGNVLNDGRLAGLIDWNSIVDRTRNLRQNPHWKSPKSILESATLQFAIDQWKDQPFHVEVWVEKDALVGVVGNACRDLDVPYFSCRGYVSQSEMWTAARRLMGYSSDFKANVILHLGDHDPSGIDMSRDIKDRLSMFGANVEVLRIALTMEQIQTYNPPPNPAKLTDARASSYISMYGDESWELDALEPSVITDLINSHVRQFRDQDMWLRRWQEQQSLKRELIDIHDYYEDAVKLTHEIREGITEPWFDYDESEFYDNM